MLENEKYNISTYFNPNLQSLVFDGLDSKCSYYLTIYNAIGRKEISNAKVGLNVNKINTSKLSSGTYFVEITNEKFEDILLKKVLIY